MADFCILDFSTSSDSEDQESQSVFKDVDFAITEVPNKCSTPVKERPSSSSNNKHTLTPDSKAATEPQPKRLATGKHLHLKTLVTDAKSDCLITIIGLLIVM